MQPAPGKRASREAIEGSTVHSSSVPRARQPWCPGRVSNPYALFRERRILSPLCLPISPRRAGRSLRVGRELEARPGVEPG